ARCTANSSSSVEPQVRIRLPPAVSHANFDIAGVGDGNRQNRRGISGVNRGRSAWSGIGSTKDLRRLHPPSIESNVMRARPIRKPTPQSPNCPGGSEATAQNLRGSDEEIPTGP